MKDLPLGLFDAFSTEPRRYSATGEWAGFRATSSLFAEIISIAYLIFKVGRAGAAMEIVAFPKARESANKFYRHRLKGLCVPVCPVKKFCVSRCVPSKNFVCPGVSLGTH